MVRVAVVTGANKGLGYAIVKGLCKSFDGDVYLTARDVERGKQAVLNLEKENFHPKFYHLDVTNRKNIEEFREFLLGKYDGLDVLVNNAAVNFHETPPPEELRVAMVMDINYFGVLNMCEFLFPILRKGARVVHISSSGGTLVLATSSAERTFELTSAEAIADVTKIINGYISDVKEDKWKENGWANSSYGISKAAVIVITAIQQRFLDEELSKPDVVVNCCCPGFVDTDMSKPIQGTNLPMDLLSPDEGADTPLYLALLPPDVKEPKGMFCRERKIYTYKNDPLVEQLIAYIEKQQ